MKLVTWNIQVVNSKGKMRYFQKIINKEKLVIVILQENKFSMERIHEIGEKSCKGGGIVNLEARGTVRIPRNSPRL